MTPAGTAAPSLQRGPALLLQAAVVLIALGTLAFLLWEPHVEGRNARATVFEIYFNDPFLAYVYAGSIPFFVALHRAFRLFGAVRREGRFSETTVAALQSIRRCATALAGLVAGGGVLILLIGDGEPAGLMMALVLTLGAAVAAIAATFLARKVQAGLVGSGASGHGVR